MGTPHHLFHQLSLSFNSQFVTLSLSPYLSRFLIVYLCVCVRSCSHQCHIPHRCKRAQKTNPAFSVLSPLTNRASALVLTTPLTEKKNSDDDAVDLYGERLSLFLFTFTPMYVRARACVFCRVDFVAHIVSARITRSRARFNPVCKCRLQIIFSFLALYTAHVSVSSRSFCLSLNFLNRRSFHQ